MWMELTFNEDTFSRSFRGIFKFNFSPHKSFTFLSTSHSHVPFIHFCLLSISCLFFHWKTFEPYSLRRQNLIHQYSRSVILRLRLNPSCLSCTTVTELYSIQYVSTLGTCCVKNFKICIGSLLFSMLFRNCKTSALFPFTRNGSSGQKEKHEIE